MICRPGFFLSIALAGWAACNPSPTAAESLLARVHAGGPVRLGYADEAPLAFRTPEGENAGLGNVLAAEILRRMRIANVEGVVTKWRSLVPDLQADRFDIITSGLFVAAPRCDEVAFSAPFGAFGDVLVVPHGNPLDLTSIQDIRARSDATLASVSNYAVLDYAFRVGVPKERMKVVFDVGEMLDAVRKGDVSAGAAMILDLQEVERGQNAEFEFVRPSTLSPFVGRHSAFAFRKEDAAFQAAFDAELKMFLGTPEFFEQVRPFGYLEAELPDPTLTTAELCEKR